MGKIFDVDFRTGSLVDRVSGTPLTTYNSPYLQRHDKGMCLWYDKSTAAGNKYAKITGVNHGVESVTYEAYIFLRPTPIGVYQQVLGNSGIGGVQGIGFISYSLSSDFNIEVTGSTTIRYYGTVNKSDLLSFFNRWSHLLIVFNRTSKTCDFYINNILLKTFSLGADPGIFPTDVYVGNNSSAGYPSIHPIAKFVGYNTVLTEAERTAAYKDFLNSYPVESLKTPDYQAMKPTDLSNEKENTFQTNLLSDPLDFLSASWTIVASATKLTDSSFSTSGSARIRNNSFTLKTGSKYKLSAKLTLTDGITFRLYDYTASTILYSIVGNGVPQIIETVFTYTPASAGIALFLTNTGVISFDYLSIQEITGLVAAYNMIPQGNTLVDISGNGNNMTFTKAVSTNRGLLFNNGYANTSSSISSFYGTYSIVLYPKKITAEQYFIANVKSGFGTLVIGMTGGNIGAYVYNGAWLGRTNFIAAKENVLTIITYTWDGTNATFYVNGTNIGIGGGFNIAALSTDQLSIGKNGKSLYSEIVEAKYINRILTTSEIQTYHNSFAKRISLKEDFSKEGADNVSKVPSGWSKTSGTFKISEMTSDDPVLKHLTKGTHFMQCVTAGIISIPSKQAYGQWEFDWYKGADTNDSYVTLCSNKISNAYYSIRLINNERVLFYSLAGGNIMYSAISYITNNTWYRIKITRSLVGVFTVYIKGGAFGNTTWTLVSTSGGVGTNPVTDNTYTTSEYFVLDLDAGDRIANIQLKEGIEV
jgi:hypothetical protein